MALTYGSYLKVDQLLALQEPQSEGAEHDEILFITVHQVYELWFKQLLHELNYLATLLDANDVSRCLHTLKRVNAIFRTLIQQIEVMETMTPLEFVAFRDRLESASGFQSYQFRCLEFFLGNKSKQKFGHYPDGEARKVLETYFNGLTLWDHMLRCLQANDCVIPEEILARDVTLPYEGNKSVQTELLSIYRTNTRLSELCEYLVDLDEGLQEWRYKHVKMVERTLGRKPGTGGSAGVGYLASTLFQPVFVDLWEIRSHF